MKKYGFSLIELLIVIIIIGILAALLFPTFLSSREAALNDEARANLKLLRAAERIYRMNIGAYYFSGSENNLNANLKVYLQTGSLMKWDYGAVIHGTSDFNVTATRALPSTSSYDRTLWINSTLEDVQCSGFCK